MKDKLTKSQKKLLKALRSGRNVFITGEAGSGKSYTLNQYIKEEEEKGKKVIVTAPTGIAALNVGGVTMHSAFAIPIPAYGRYANEIRLSQIKAVCLADIIIIDEISMCRNDVFEFFAGVVQRINKELGKTQQIIVSGDFYQLPPVVTKTDVKNLKKFGFDESGFCFTTPSWQKFKFKTIELEEVVRQNDPDFISNLNLLRRGNKKCIPYFNKRVTNELKDGIIHICSTNQTVDLINDEHLSLLDTPRVLYSSERTGRTAKEYQVEDNLVVKIGARVMFMVNDVIDNKYQNGSIGTVTDVKEKYCVVKLDNTNEEINVYPYEWKVYDIKAKGESIQKKEIGTYKQLPLKLAYAITMHKTQGQTYEEVCITPDSFADGQLYVALSRVKSYEGIYLSEDILPDYIKVNKEVDKFYKNNFKYEVKKSILEKRKTLEKKALEKDKKKSKSKSKAKTSTKKATTKKTSKAKAKTTSKSKSKTTKKTTSKTSKRVAKKTSSKTK